MSVFNVGDAVRLNDIIYKIIALSKNGKPKTVQAIKTLDGRELNSKQKWTGDYDGYGWILIKPKKKKKFV